MPRPPPSWPPPLADLLGLERFAVVGHDFGGSVAYALAAAYLDRVTHLVVAEELLPRVAVPPSLVSPRYPRWHNAFHAVPDVPDLLISARETDYLNLFRALTAPGKPLPAHVIEACGRYPAEEQPARVADLIAAFVGSSSPTVV